LSRSKDMERSGRRGRLYTFAERGFERGAVFEWCAEGEIDRGTAGGIGVDHRVMVTSVFPSGHQ